MSALNYGMFLLHHRHVQPLGTKTQVSVTIVLSNNIHFTACVLAVSVPQRNLG